MVSAPTEVQPVLEPSENRPPRALIVRHLCLLAPAAAAAVLWAWSVSGIHLRAMNDLGLVSVLPWPTWLAFALLTLGFIVCWRRADQATWLLLVHVLLLIVMLYGLPALASHEPSGPVVYRHAGITGDLIQNRVVDPRIDAYFNWPGFFMGLGTLVKLAGVPSALSFATWATVAFNLLFLPPLLLVVRALTRDPRLVWGTVWVFYAANWINQDYLAPQSFAYLLYLTIMGLLLTYLRPSATDLERGGRLRRFRQVLRVRAAEAQVPPVSRSTVAGILAVVVLLYAVIVASHQLTPFAILIGVLALVALGECTARGLPLLMGVMLTLWVTFVARGYLAGHFTHLVSGVGDINAATSSNLTARISGSPLHLLVIRERLLLSGGLWLLALLGAIRRFRSRYADHAAAALALTPLLLFPLQAYGGEMLMRIYFFMLPFVAFFATAAFLPARLPPSPARAGPQDLLAVWSERARPREFVMVWSERARLRARLRDFLVVWFERARLRALPVVWSARARLRDLQAVWSARARLPAALRGSVAAAAAFGVTVTAVLAACLPARYGNERIDYFTPGEHAAISFLYAHARPGSTFAFEQPYLPWKYQEYELYHARSLAAMITQRPPPSPAQALNWFSRELMPAPGNPAGFVILTRSQHIYVHTFGGPLSRGYLGTFERLLAASPNFALVYSNPDAKIYERLPGVSHGCKVVAPWNRHSLRGCAGHTPRHRDR